MTNYALFYFWSTAWAYRYCNQLLRTVQGLWLLKIILCYTLLLMHFLFVFSYLLWISIWFWLYYLLQLNDFRCQHELRYLGKGDDIDLQALGSPNSRMLRLSALKEQDLTSFWNFQNLCNGFGQVRHIKEHKVWDRFNQLCVDMFISNGREIVRLHKILH